MTWKEDIQRLVEQNWRKGAQFNLRDVYAAAGSIRRRHRGNSHPDDKIRQILQELRDEGLLDFVDNQGTYLRLK